MHSYSPLRDRREDIIDLRRHLLEQLAQESNIPLAPLGAEARRALVSYDWPGNVRELSNTLERTLSSMEGDIIDLDDLPYRIHRKQKANGTSAAAASLRIAHSKAEIEAIRYALKASGNNKSQAARMLGIHRTLLYKKMKKYDLSIQADH